MILKAMKLHVISKAMSICREERGKSVMQEEKGVAGEIPFHGQEARI